MSGRAVPPRRPVAAAEAHLDLSQDVPVVVVDVTDWLDLATAPGVRAVLDAALERAPRRLAIDLSQCAVADAYGLSMLERAQRRAALQGTELVLVGTSPRIRRVLHLTGLADVLRVELDLTAAS